MGIVDGRPRPGPTTLIQYHRTSLVAEKNFRLARLDFFGDLIKSRLSPSTSEKRNRESG